MDNEDNLYDRPSDESEPTDREDAPDQGQGSPSLLNKESWPDAKPGETRTFRCLKVMDNEIEVTAMEDDGQEQSEAPAEPTMAGQGEGGGGGDGMMD